MEIGNWFKVNGDVIYGICYWKCFGEGLIEVVEGYMLEYKGKCVFGV